MIINIIFYKHWIILLNYFTLLFVLSGQQIIHNPIISDKEFNPIDYILIPKESTVKVKISSLKFLTLNIESNFLKNFHESYIVAQPLFFFNDESNKLFLFLEDKYYKVELSPGNEDKRFSQKKALREGIKYLGFITCIESTYNNFPSNAYRTYYNEIIIYGQKGGTIYFYYLLDDKYVTFSTSYSSGKLISCKLCRGSIYICIFSINDDIEISIFLFSESRQMIRFSPETLNIFIGYENAIIYDTSNYDYKIICAKKKVNNNIECIAIYIDLITSYWSGHYDYNIIQLNNDTQFLFSYQEDNCNFTIYNSEYLLCCGKKDFIFCDRRDLDFNIINYFNISLQGKISNLTFENNNTEYLKLIYSNTKDNVNIIYEYFIYPPVCKKIQITITSFQTVKVNISNLFERKTNTNYYISFDNLPINFATFQINDNIINNNDTILIEDIENYLDIICIGEFETKNYTINFNISIEETYSQMCQISIIYKNSSKNNIELIADFISSDSSSSVISNSEKIQVISTSDKMSIEEQLKTGVSPADLGYCTKSLKEFYNISEEENLIIINQEKRGNNEKNKSSENDDNSVTLDKYSQIEIYDFSGSKLDLSICKEGIKILKYIGDVEEININSAKNFADSGIDIFNPSSDFFNSLCFQYDNDDGKDIIISDRRKDIFQNISFCQNGCKYEGMNYDLLVANCICDSNSLQEEKNFTQNEYNNIETSQFNEIVNSFLANLLDFNIGVLYCYNLVFNIQKLKRNIGFYFMMSMIIFQIFCLCIFLFKKLKPIKAYLIKNKALANPLKGKIEKILNANIKGKKIEQQNLGKKNNNEKRGSTKKFSFNNNKNELFNKSDVSSKIRMNNFKNYRYNIKIHNLLSKKKKKYNYDNAFSKKGAPSSNLKFEKSVRGKNNEINSINIYNFKKKRFKNKKEQDNFMVNEKNNTNNCIKLSQKDEDLQDMDFKFAVIKDKRSCLRIYWSYLVESQIILGTFFTENYLDLFVIKFSFFICTFQISFFLNAFFYTDEYISNAYHNDGILDFVTGLPKALYSFIATLITTNLLRMLSNSKSELLQIIRHRKKALNYIKIVNNKLIKLSCKLFIYFTLTFLLGLFFLYYVTSFCAVYSHSQKYWFMGCLESFAIDSLVSFIICILISTLRYIAIHKQIKCLYCLVNLISVII